MELDFNIEKKESNSAEELANWRGICREFGCSEAQIRELYSGPGESENAFETLVTIGDDWTDDVTACTRRLQN